MPRPLSETPYVSELGIPCGQQRKRAPGASRAHPLLFPPGIGTVQDEEVSDGADFAAPARQS